MSDSNQDAERLVEERRFQDALELLSAHLEADSDGETHALAGAAHYGLEEYGEAAASFEWALRLGPSRQTWRDMLMQSRANALAEVNVSVPDIAFFDRDALLAEPVVKEGSLPPTPMASPGRSFL